MSIAKCFNIIGLLLGFCSAVMLSSNGIKCISFSPKIERFLEIFIITGSNKLKPNLWSYHKAFWMFFIAALSWISIWLLPPFVRLYKHYHVIGTYRAHTLIFTKQHLFRMPDEIASIIHNNEYCSIISVNFLLIIIPAIIYGILVIIRLINYSLNLISFITLQASARVIGVESDDNTKLGAKLFMWSLFFSFFGTLIG